MKKFLVLLLLSTAVKIQAQTLVMTDETTDISFLTKHLAGRLEGNFKGVEGSSRFNDSDLANCYLKLSFATSTINTNDQVLGPDFIRARCFDPAKYPTLEIASDSIIKLDGINRYGFIGTLKVKGITKPVKFPFTAKENAGGYDFNFSFSFIKKHFGMHCGTTTGRHFKIIVRAYAKESRSLTRLSYL